MRTGAPNSAKTLGQGGVRVTTISEAPVVDLIASDDDVIREGYPVAPLPAESLQVGVGITDEIDIEASLDGTLIIPFGVSIGGRAQLLRDAKHAVSVSLTLGELGAGVSYDDDVISEIGAYYGKVAAHYEAFTGPFGFRGSLNYTMARVYQTAKDGVEQNFTAHAPSATGGIGIRLGAVEIAPYGTVTYLNTPALDGGSWIASGGLLLGFRWDKFGLVPDAGPPPAGPPPPPAPPVSY